MPLIAAVSDLGGPEAKFIAMSRMLDGARRLDWQLSGGELFEEVVAREVAAQTPRRRRQLTPDAEGLLRIAWQMELTARVSEQIDDEGMRLAGLASLPVQGYYAVFNAARAFHLIAGANIDTHARIKATFQSERARHCFGSLRYSLAGDPQDAASCTLNGPRQRNDDSGFNPMEHRDDPVDHIWAALRTARKWVLRTARQAWLEKARKPDGSKYRKLTPQGKADVLGGLRPTTYMDLLYELRCSTNYRTVDEFAHALDDEHVRRYDNGLRHLYSSALLSYEAGIAQNVGGHELLRAYRTWESRAASIGSWAVDAPGRRIRALAGAL